MMKKFFYEMGNGKFIVITGCLLLTCIPSYYLEFKGRLPVYSSNYFTTAVISFIFVLFSFKMMDNLLAQLKGLPKLEPYLNRFRMECSKPCYFTTLRRLLVSIILFMFLLNSLEIGRTLKVIMCITYSLLYLFIWFSIDYQSNFYLVFKPLEEVFTEDLKQPSSPGNTVIVIPVLYSNLVLNQVAYFVTSFFMMLVPLFFKDVSKVVPVSQYVVFFVYMIAAFWLILTCITFIRMIHENKDRIPEL